MSPYQFVFFCINSPEVLNEKQHHELPKSFKNTTKQSKQVSQVNFMSPLCSVSYPLATVRLERSSSNPLGFYSEKTPSPGELLGTPGVSHLHLPSTTAPQGPLTHPGLSFSSPLQPVGEEVKVTPLPLSQEGVPQLEHVSMHDAVLPQGII